MTEILDYQTKVGVLYTGGCGSNTARSIIDSLDPSGYPGFFHFVANTDAKAHQRSFGSGQTEAQKERLKLWTDAGAVTIHQLGGAEVTKGRGAGGKPEVGRKAAETEHSMQCMREFFDSVDEVILMGGFGGGTGTGALPVGAKLAVEMKKPTLAIVVIPDPRERRTERAAKALMETKNLVPTIAIRNGYLKEMISDWEEEEQDKLTFPEGWKIINDCSLVPMLLIVREIVQVTGDINLDQADWETMLSGGNDVFFGKADMSESENWAKRLVKKMVSKEWPKGSAEQIVEDLFSGPFQDSGIIERGAVIGLWAHGPWPMKLTDRIIELIGERITGHKEKKPEVFFGIVNEVEDGKMWIALLVMAPVPKIITTGGVAETLQIFVDAIIAKEEAAQSAVEVRQETAGRTKAAPASHSTEREVAPQVEIRVDRAERAKATERATAKPEPPPPIVMGAISFRHAAATGGYAHPTVSLELQKRFNAMYRNDSTSRAEMEKLFDDVEGETKIRPDMPERLAIKEEKEQRKSMWGRLA